MAHLLERIHFCKKEISNATNQNKHDCFSTDCNASKPRLICQEERVEPSRNMALAMELLFGMIFPDVAKPHAAAHAAAHGVSPAHVAAHWSHSWVHPSGTLSSVARASKCWQTANECQFACTFSDWKRWGNDKRMRPKLLVVGAP